MWKRMSLQWIWLAAFVDLALALGTADVLVNRLVWRADDLWGEPTDAWVSFVTYLAASAIIWQIVAFVLLFVFAAVSASRRPAARAARRLAAERLKVSVTH